MYMTPSKRAVAPLTKPPAEGPIAEFIAVIEATPNDAWQTRTQAFQQLVEQIPTGAKYASSPASWFNNPPTLRHLAIPISALLKDGRSTVVKRTCLSLTKLFQRCQSDARYLFKDIIPTILSVHAQTVQVIRTAVQTMVTESIPEVPCKMIMPLWMERLKVDKSRTVREACVVYLTLALKSWTEEGYLTDEIWNQVGSILLQSLRDPSPTVRAEAKNALRYMKESQPSVFDELTQENEDSPMARDPKLKRWIRSLDTNNNEEELSVASKWSYNHDIRNSATPRKPTTIPSDIHVSHSTLTERSGNRGGLGPPLRRTLSKETPETTPLDEPQVTQSNSFPDELGSFVSSRKSENSLSQSRQLESSPSIERAPTGSSAKPIELLPQDGPIISSATDLKKHASLRRSRNSILMQERFRMSLSIGASGSLDEMDPPVTAAPLSPAGAPEHMVIAIRLLKAHKEHVDSIMETLRMEMDVLRDFDKLLEEPGRPTEEEVLNYFESVGLCLDQRTQSGAQLQVEMDKISRGEPPE